MVSDADYLRKHVEHEIPSRFRLRRASRGGGLSLSLCAWQRAWRVRRRDGIRACTRAHGHARRRRGRALPAGRSRCGLADWTARSTLSSPGGAGGYVDSPTSTKDRHECSRGETDDQIPIHAQRSVGSPIGGHRHLLELHQLRILLVKPLRQGVALVIRPGAIGGILLVRSSLVTAAKVGRLAQSATAATDRSVGAVGGGMACAVGLDGFIGDGRR